jgi:hypothetical protein
MDWIETYSPMYVNWKHKWMIISYQDRSVVIHGLKHAVPTDALLEIRHSSQATLAIDPPLHVELTPELLNLLASDLPAPVMELLSKYQTLFEEPKSLPPSQFCDHNIPLIKGA